MFVCPKWYSSRIKWALIDNITSTREQKCPRLDGVEAVVGKGDEIIPYIQFKGAGLQDCDGVCTKIQETDRWQPLKRF